MKKKTLPETSLAANKAAVMEMRQEHHGKIINALKSIGSGNYEDISRSAGMDKHQVGRRLSELEALQIVFKPGSKSPTRSGREAYIYQLTGASQPKTDVEEKNIQSAAADKNEKTKENKVSTIKYVEQDLFA